jgi:hypothetical protein
VSSSIINLSGVDLESAEIKSVNLATASAKKPSHCVRKSEINRAHYQTIKSLEERVATLEQQLEQHRKRFSCLHTEVECYRKRFGYLESEVGLIPGPICKPKLVFPRSQEKYTTLSDSIRRELLANRYRPLSDSD